MLVAEMIDMEATIATIRWNTGNADTPQIRNAIEHLRKHHLTPSDVGKLARTSQVGSVVVTHLAGDNPTSRDAARFEREIGEIYPGPIIVANDLDRF